MPPKNLRDILARKAEIKTRLSDGTDITDEELGALEAEMRQLDKDEIEARKADLLQRARPIPAGEPTTETREEDDPLATREYRNAFFRRLQNKRLTAEEQRALDTGSTSAGAAVPTQTLNLIKEKLYQYSVLWPLVSKSFIPGNLVVPVSNAQADAAWHTQNNPVTPVDDTLSGVNLGGYELIKIVTMSKAAWLMSIDAFEAYIVGQITKKLARAIENAILNGNGTGQPTGILAGITWDATNSGTWTNAGMTYDDVNNGIAILPTMYLQNATLVMNRKVAAVVRSVKSTTGFPIFLPDARQGGPGSVIGYPLVVNDLMPDDTILFGDLDYWHANVQQGPIIDISMESSFRSAGIDYRGYMLMDGKPLLGEAFVKLTKSAT